jgi:hypothetical protein
LPSQAAYLLEVLLRPVVGRITDLRELAKSVQAVGQGLVATKQQSGGQMMQMMQLMQMMQMMQMMQAKSGR